MPKIRNSQWQTLLCYYIRIVSQQWSPICTLFALRITLQYKNNTKKDVGRDRGDSREGAQCGRRVAARVQKERERDERSTNESLHHDSELVRLSGVSLLFAFQKRANKIYEATI